MDDLFYSLLGLVTQSLIPWTIGYFRQMSFLKKGKEPYDNKRLPWIILPALAICILSVAGLNHCPPLEDFFACLYLLSFTAVVYTTAFALGRWSAKSDFRRKRNS